MGAWGVGPFENDAAIAWLEALKRATADGAGPDFLSAAIEPFADPALGVIEADEAGQALAASEVVAALLGRPAAGLPAPVGAWLEGQRPALRDTALALRPTALATLSRVKNASELHGLAAEADMLAPFETAVDELHERLRMAA